MQSGHTITNTRVLGVIVLNTDFKKCAALVESFTVCYRYIEH